MCIINWVILDLCYSIGVRAVIKVDSLKNMNDALSFIEENLTNKIDEGVVLSSVWRHVITR